MFKSLSALLLIGVGLASDVTTSVGDATPSAPEAAADTCTPRYNILSLDAAKYKGIMTATMVSYMEQYAYTTARSHGYIEERTSGRISMPELFDMVAGSETGAIIATTIVLPNTNTSSRDNQPNKYFADTAVDFFSKNVDILYHDAQMPMLLKFVIILMFSGIVCSIVYFGTEKVYNVDGFDDQVDQLIVLIKLRKKMAKGKTIDEDQESRLT